MKETSLLDQYLDKINEITNLMSDQEDQAIKVGALIDQFSERNQLKEEYKHLFKGEKAFWNKDFKLALENYLKAKEIPHIQFFCYRASAYLSEKIGSDKKAVEFAEKALNFYPNDPPTLHILEKINPHKESDGESSQEMLSELEKLFQESHTLSSLFVEDAPQINSLEKKGSFHSVESPEISTAMIVTKLEKFQSRQTAIIEEYQKQVENRTLLSSQFLQVFNGWNLNTPNSTPTTPLGKILLKDRLKEPQTGVYFRWNGVGFVINPGRYFLDHFLEAGLLLQDINFVIATQNKPDTFHDLIPIYALNDRLNQLSAEPHTIQYYLHPSVYEQVSPRLKPHYKKEKHMLHSLSMFVDSPQVEKITLDEGVSMSYFSPTASSSNSSLGVLFKLPTEHASIQLGYISGCCWSPLLSAHLKGTDVLLLGVGRTTEEDYLQKSYLPDCLGYNGSLSLIKELNPKLALCSEFSGHNGDLRLEIIQLMQRQLLQDDTPCQTTLIPVDKNFTLDLERLLVRCNTSQQFTSPDQIHVARLKDAHLPLQYLSDDHIL